MRPRKALEHARLRADGMRLIDPLGRTVLLRGVNFGGRSKLAPFLPFDVETDDATAFEHALGRAVDRLAGWGFDLVRLPFSWEGIEPERGRVDERYLDRIARMIDALWSRGIRVIVDFHQDVYATPFSGDGFPLWTLGSISHGGPRSDDRAWFARYSERGGPVQRAFGRLWRNEDALLDAWRRMWRRVAMRVGRRPGVLGFEPINEPGWGPEHTIERFEREILTPEIERVGRMLIDCAPGALIVQGGCGTDGPSGGTAMERPALMGFVYGAHVYDPRVFGGDPFTRDAAWLRELVRRQIEVARRWGVPMMLAEFGGSSSSIDQLPAIDATYAELDAAVAHAAVWEISFSVDERLSDDLRLTHADGRPKPAMDVVVRGHPRAIDGTILGYEWDASRKTMRVEVDAAGEEVSELWLPREVGRSPR
jgi:endoglycosylceramidase